MSFKHGLLFLSLVCGYHGNPFLVDHDPSSLFVEPAARPIVGGDVAPRGSAPYMVALYKGSNFTCGSSLISARTVLTAAHCLNKEASSYNGLVGTNDLNSGGFKIYFEKKIVHPAWNPSINLNNDIGLLITTKPVPFSDLVKPVTLSYQHIGGGVMLKATGWGLTQYPGDISTVLMQLFMTSLDPQECRKIIGPSVKPDTMLCVYNDVDHGLCSGDSGSAVVRKDSGEQVGVVSWSRELCAKGKPDGLARVSGFENFIETNKVN